MRTDRGATQTGPGLSEPAVREHQSAPAAGGPPQGQQQQGGADIDPECEFAVFAPAHGPQPQDQQQRRQQQQTMLSEAVELQHGIAGLIADGLGLEGGMRYEEMCHVLTVIMDKAFEGNSEFDRPMVVHISCNDGEPLPGRNTLHVRCGQPRSIVLHAVGSMLSSAMSLPAHQGHFAPFSVGQCVAHQLSTMCAQQAVKTLLYC